MSSLKLIANAELTAADVPPDGASWEQIIPFALSFDGYEENGSFEKCGDIANVRRNETLSDLRTCLFFEQRRWRHFGHNPDPQTMDYIRGLVRAIREKISPTI